MKFATKMILFAYSYDCLLSMCNTPALINLGFFHKSHVLLTYSLGRKSMRINNIQKLGNTALGARKCKGKNNL